MNAFGPKTLDPKEAIMHRLRFYASRACPCVPDFVTVQFLKARILPEHQLHAVTFQDTTGQPWYFTYFLRQRRDASWRVKFSRGNRGPVEPPTSSSPWLHLHVDWDAFREFLVGGEVLGNSFDIVRVRLLSPNGRVLEDTVQEGLVLFWTDKPVVLPLQAELYNRSAELVNSHSVLTLPSQG